MPDVALHAPLSVACYGQCQFYGEQGIILSAEGDKASLHEHPWLLGIFFSTTFQCIFVGAYTAADTLTCCTELTEATA